MRVGLIILTFVTVALGFFFPLVDCSSHLNHSTLAQVNKWIQTVYLLFLSGISLLVAQKLGRQLLLANQDEIRKRLFYLEGVI